LFSLKTKQTKLERKHRLWHPSRSAITGSSTEPTLCRSIHNFCCQKMATQANFFLKKKHWTHPN